MIHTVTFPGLGLSFELDRVAFTVFGHNVYWYGVIIAAGFLLAVLFCTRIAWRFGIDSECIIDLLFFAVPLSIIGARAYYVIFYLDLYLNEDGSFNWVKAVKIWDGGLAIYGGIIMAIVTVAVFCRVRKINTLAFLDMGSFGMIIGQCIGRWGNFVNVEAYGGVTGLPWRMCSESIANELWNKGLLESEEACQAVLDGTLGVHPTFFYESMWNLIGLILLYLIARKWRKVDGQIFLSYMVWYGAGRAFIEGLRTDSLYFFGTGIRTSQMLGILFAVVGAVWLIWRLRKAGPAAAPLLTKSSAPAETAAEGRKEEHTETTERISEEDDTHGSDQD